MSYAADLNPTTCTQPKRGMVAGAGGGYGYKITDADRLHRFLILGHEGGTYYANQASLTFETVDCIDRLLDSAKNLGEIDKIVNTIAEVSNSGRAPKNDSAIFALAYVVSKGGYAAESAYAVLPGVCRIGTHLFQFVDYCTKLGKGWGSGFRRAINNWYLDRTPLVVAKQVTKYQSRCGWSHRDIFRKAHPASTSMNDVFQYVTQPERWKDATHVVSDAMEYLNAVERAKQASVDDLCDLIREYKLPREVIPTTMLNSVDVWDALLDSMPLTAMIRNFGKMSSIGLIKPLSDASMKVVNALRDTASLKTQRVHPLTLLVAQKTYSNGRGVRGSLNWRPDQKVVQALDEAFYAAFDYVEPTGKSFLLGIDVSGSMNHGVCAGCDVLTPREAAAAMAMLTARTEDRSYMLAFSHTIQMLDINPSDSLAAVIRKMSGLRFGATRCAAAIEYAIDQELDVDVFCLYTDNETNTGPHPVNALNAYRRKFNKAAKFAAFGFAQTSFSLADPADCGMMDFVGFDTAAPTLLSDFARN